MRLGEAGPVRSGAAELGRVRYGKAWLGRAGRARPISVGLGTVRLGAKWHGVAGRLWRGAFRLGEAKSWHGRHGGVRHGVGPVRRDMARPVEAGKQKGGSSEPPFSLRIQ